MTWLEHGRIQGGAIVLPRPLPLPEGTPVTVRIETAGASEAAVGPTGGDFLSLPFFGMWADREDMNPSAAWVRQEREQWQQRTRRQD
jgi:hypothetical protein